MFIDFLLHVFAENHDQDAVIWINKSYDYKWLIDTIQKYDKIIKSQGINEGTVVALKGDFDPNSIAVLLSLMQNSCIIVPLSNDTIIDNLQLYNISKVEFVLTIDKENNLSAKKLSDRQENKFYEIIRNKKHPGLVLFTSGTSGEPKAAVHDFLLLLEKFRKKGKALRTINFLLFDHWGGLNTMFHVLSNGGCVIATKVRTPQNICELIQLYKIQLLPATPTFLNLLILSGSYENYDLSSLKIISYGTEPMPERTLKRLKKIFPDVNLLQTYGLIELGVMKSKSEKNDSLWVKVGGEDYKTRIVDGILHIKAKSAMLGYLNAPSPFSDDGWFITGDQVIEKDEYIKILGRNSEIINVGGEKVYPQEVENIILEMDNVSDVTVSGEKNLIVGNIVTASVKLIKSQDKQIFSKILKNFCSSRLENYKIPVKVKIVGDQLYNERFKKIRKTN